jgi:hypothetical protein
LMASRRPETMAKRAREQAVKEKRERKHERKQAAAAARLAGDVAPVENGEGEPGSDADMPGEPLSEETASSATALNGTPPAE